MYTCKCRKFTSSFFVHLYIWKKEKTKQKKIVGFISYYYIYQLSHALNIRQRKGNERKRKLFKCMCMCGCICVSFLFVCLFVCAWSEILLRKFQFQKKTTADDENVSWLHFPGRHNENKHSSSSMQFEWFFFRDKNKIKSVSLDT